MALTILPNAGQKLGQTRAAIRQNFSDINTGFAVNHNALNSGAGSGKHKNVTFPVQAAAPVPTGTDVDVYLASSPLRVGATVPGVVNVGQLFFRRDAANTLTPNPVPFTAWRYDGAEGWCYLPSGILLKWGYQSANGTNNGNPVTILFPANPDIPVFTQIFNIQITTRGENPADPPTPPNLYAHLIDYTVAQFRIWASQRTTTTAELVNFDYFAIGI